MQELGSIIEESIDTTENHTLKREFEEVKLLGLNSEKYITFKWNNMWFLDSFKFQSASLSKLVKNLGKDDMTVIKELFKLHGLTDEQVDVLCKKGVFPYIWFDSYDKMEWRTLPERKYFQSDDEYEFACEAWKILECKTFEDYHDKYLLADVVLLAGCFHAFRKSIYNMHKTDPAYFLGLPGLS